MLSLSMVKNSGLMIGDNIRIVIVDIVDNRKVQIGITAPKEYDILRDNAKTKTPKGEKP